MANWSKPLRYIVLREMKVSFASPVVVAGFIFSLAAMLAVLWYTSKAFVPSFDHLGAPSSYFEFVLIGEIFLLAPLAAIHSYTRAARTVLYEKTLDALLLLPRPFYLSLFLLQFGPFAVESVRWLVLLSIGLLLLPDALVFTDVFLLLVFQLFTLPIFWSMGQMACAFLIRFGRGQNFIAMFMTLFAILGGVYFPTQVLPDPVHRFFAGFSPFNIVLDLSRVVLAQGWREPDWFGVFAALAAWTVLSVPLSLYFLKKSIQYYRQGRTLNYLVQ